jgi:hypothetical protein
MKSPLRHDIEARGHLLIDFGLKPLGGHSAW